MATTAAADDNMATIADQFARAVHVIRNLPKSGHFKPTDELRLRFYAYYKQATDGNNRSPKPAFYDLVGKYKWSAWTKCRDMSQSQAMANYIDVFIEVLSDMILTDSDRQLFELLVPFKQYLPETSRQVLAKNNY